MQKKKKEKQNNPQPKRKTKNLFIPGIVKLYIFIGLSSIWLRYYPKEKFTSVPLDEVAEGVPIAWRRTVSDSSVLIACAQ